MMTIWFFLRKDNGSLWKVLFSSFFISSISWENYKFIGLLFMAYRSLGISRGKNGYDTDLKVEEVFTPATKIEIWIQITKEKKEEESRLKKFSWPILFIYFDISFVLYKFIFLLLSIVFYFPFDCIVTEKRNY